MSVSTSHSRELTRSMCLRLSSSLQLRFFNRWASSMMTQRHSISRSSGQSDKIISKVVIKASNLYAPGMRRPYSRNRCSQKRRLLNTCPPAEFWMSLVYLRKINKEQLHYHQLPSLFISPRVSAKSPNVILSTDSASWENNRPSTLSGAAHVWLWYAQLM